MIQRIENLTSSPSQISHCGFALEARCNGKRYDMVMNPAATELVQGSFKYSTCKPRGNRRVTTLQLREVVFLGFWTFLKSFRLASYYCDFLYSAKSKTGP